MTVSSAAARVVRLFQRLSAQRNIGEPVAADQYEPPASNAPSRLQATWLRLPPDKPATFAEPTRRRSGIDRRRSGIDRRRSGIERMSTASVSLYPTASALPSGVNATV